MALKDLSDGHEVGGLRVALLQNLIPSLNRALEEVIIPDQGRYQELWKFRLHWTSWFKAVKFLP